jgi:hypothetical protein
MCKLAWIPLLRPASRGLQVDVANREQLLNHGTLSPSVDAGVFTVEVGIYKMFINIIRTTLGQLVTIQWCRNAKQRDIPADGPIRVIGGSTRKWARISHKVYLDDSIDRSYS